MQPDPFQPANEHHGNPAVNHGPAAPYHQQTQPQAPQAWEPIPLPAPAGPGSATPSAAALAEATLPMDMSPTKPIPVVRVLSPMGVEYVFLTIALFVGGGSLMGVLLLLVNGVTSFEALAIPTAALVVTLPLFAGLFLHLKRLELRNPALRLDPSKRRSTQFTQIVAFIVCLLSVISLMTYIFASIGGGEGGAPLWKAVLNTLCILAVAGGILAYYWYDEHRNAR